MEAQESLEFDAGPAFDVDLSRSLPPPTRQDTASTRSSGKYTPLPPGFYKLPIHGNCPRCHHHHSSAEVRVRMSEDSTRVSNVNCQKCGQRWLAFGGRNATCISLLSTQTTDPDERELRFRYTLINLVRSATSIGSVASPSAALGSVPELPSPGPSRGSSVRNTNTREVDAASQTLPVAAKPEPARDELPTTSSRPLGSGLPELSPDPTASGAKQRRNFMGHLKTKFKDRLSILRTFRMEKLSRPTRKPQITDKGKGRLLEPVYMPTPNTQENGDVLSSPTHIELPKDELGVQISGNPPAMDSGSSRVAFDKEALKRMNTNERIAWVRRQITDFKCRCPNNCQDRQAVSSPIRSSIGEASSPVEGPPPSSELPAEGSITRRRSTDTIFAGIGSHLPLGTWSYRTRHLSIASTRLSQAATVVDSDTMTVISGPPPTPTQVLQPQQVRRPRSSRPQSLPVPPRTMSPLRHSRIPEDRDSRSSMDSFATGGAVRSLSRNATLTHRHSAFSLPPPSTPADNIDESGLLQEL